MKTKNVPLRFDEQEHKDFKMFCVQHGISMQEFVEKAVREARRKWEVPA